MRVTFGQTSTDLPDGWTDGSIIKFADLSQPAEEGSAQPSIVITRADDGGDALPAILDAHTEQLSETLVGFEVVERGSANGRNGDVHYLQHSFGEDGEFSQILLLTIASGTVYIVTGTANTADFAALRPRFIGVATSLDAEAAGSNT